MKMCIWCMLLDCFSGTDSAVNTSEEERHPQVSWRYLCQWEEHNCWMKPDTCHKQQFLTMTVDTVCRFLFNILPLRICELNFSKPKLGWAVQPAHSYKKTSNIICMSCLSAIYYCWWQNNATVRNQLQFEILPEILKISGGGGPFSEVERLDQFCLSFTFLSFNPISSLFICLTSWPGGGVRCPSTAGAGTARQNEPIWFVFKVEMTIRW